MKKKRGALRIDVRDIRIPGGRFTCSARTTSAPEFRRREAAIRALIEAGAVDVLARITAAGEGKLHIAEVAAAVAKGEIDSLRAVKGSGLLQLGAVVERFQRRKDATRSENTRAQVAIIARQIEQALGVERDLKGQVVKDVDMTLTTRDEAEAFLHRARVDGRAWAPSSQAVKLAYARELWRFAIEEEAEAAERERRRPRLRQNVWDRVEAAPIVKTRVVFLTRAERDALLSRLEGTVACALLGVGYLAGLRIGEAIHLRPGIDVDLTAGVLHIQGRGGEHAWLTKNRRSRTVPINRTLRAILEDHMERGYAGERFFFRLPGQDRPLSDHTARRWWMDAYTLAGIKTGRSEVDGVTFHTGRHSFASLLVQQGVSPLVVAELIGDRYQEVVETYGHLSPHNLTDAVKLLERE